MKKHILQEYKTIRTGKPFQNITNVDEIVRLPNRSYISNKIKELMDSDDTDSKFIAIMMLDLSHFNEITSLIGYVNGERLVGMLVSRAQDMLTEHDYILRLSQSEFGMVVSSFSGEEELLPWIESVMDALSEPFEIGNRKVIITIHLGVSTYPLHSQHPDHLLHLAELSMFKAKQNNSKNYQVYQAEFIRESIARSELHYSLKNAISNQELELYYQPQVELRTQNIISAEVLLRWKHPILGMISPDKFIPLAEESGLIIDIGKWVLSTAMQRLAIWNLYALQPISLSINLSSKQFTGNDLVESISAILQETGCKAQWVKLEITESLLINDTPELLVTLMKLSDMGFEISIDDFGTGYSALSYLTRYPISQIKIDRSFIMDIPIDLEKCELVKVLIQIAKILHMELVAEGVENRDQLKYLTANGCEYVQGYFFGKPMPEEGFIKRLGLTEFTSEAI